MVERAHVEARGGAVRHAVEGVLQVEVEHVGVGPARAHRLHPLAQTLFVAAEVFADDVTLPAARLRGHRLDPVGREIFLEAAHEIQTVAVEADRVGEPLAPVFETRLHAAGRERARVEGVEVLTEDFRVWHYVVVAAV